MPARRRNNLLATAISAAGLLIAASGALGQDKTFELSFRIGCRPPSAAEAMGNGAPSVEKASNGTSNRRCSVPAVGKAFDHYDMAGRHRRLHLCQSGYQPGRFPIISAGELRSSSATPRAASAGRHLVSQYAPSEMKDVKYCLLLHPRSAHLALEQEENRGPGDIKE